MSARLRSITWISPHGYSLVFDVDGATRTCACKVIEHAGIRLVQAEPDFLFELGISPRLIAAAVIAVDQVNDAGPADAPAPAP